MPNEAKKIADNLLGEAYKSYYSAIYRFCLSKLKNDRDSVEDIVQETYLVLYNKYLEGVEVKFVQAFLLKTADNLIKKRYAELSKIQNQVPIDEVVHIPSQNQDLDERLSFEEYSRQISDALNDTDAELFSMRYVEELKIDEIAERMNMSISAVTTRLSRIRNKLQKIFTDMNKS